MKLFSVTQNARIHFYSEPIRMNAMIDKLSEIVAQEGQKPQSGDVFVFMNKRQNYVKALFHHKNGCQVLAKRLDPLCRFEPLQSGVISPQAMTRMLEQVTISGKKPPKLRKVA